MAVHKARPNAIRLTRQRQRAPARSCWLTQRMDAGSKPTVGSNYSITGATKSLRLKLDEFHLLVVNLPRGHRWKELNTIFILKHTDRCAREIVAL